MAGKRKGLDTLSFSYNRVMRLRINTTRSQEGYLRSLQEVWSKRLGRKVNCAEIVRWLLDEGIKRHDWRPLPGGKLRLSDMLEKVKVTSDQKQRVGT